MNIYTDKELIENITAGVFAVTVVIMIFITIIMTKKSLQSEEMKLLLQTVKELHLKGELDELKWNKLRNKFIVFVTILLTSLIIIFFITLSMHKMDWFILIFIIVSVIFYPSLIDTARMFLTYTKACKTTAIVVSGYVDSTSKGCLNMYKYKCEFVDELNTKHTFYGRHNLSVNNRIQQTPIGDTVEVLYLKENPKISVRYWEQLEQKYNLRKQSSLN